MHTSLVQVRELKVVALARHPHGDVADAGPGVEPGAQRVERTIVREHRAPGKPKRCHEQPTAPVNHGNREVIP